MSTYGRPMKNQPWPREPWSADIVDGQLRILDAKGNDITNDEAARERMLACVNGFTGVWLAEDHVKETAARIDKLKEQARSADSPIPSPKPERIAS